MFRTDIYLAQLNILQNKKKIYDVTMYHYVTERGVEDVAPYKVAGNGIAICFDMQIFL